MAQNFFQPPDEQGEDDASNLMNYFRPVPIPGMQPQPPLDRFGIRDNWGGPGPTMPQPATAAPAPTSNYDPEAATADYQKMSPAFGLPDTSGISSARQRMSDIYAQQPQRGDYKPSIWRTLGSAAAGGAVAYAGRGTPQSIQQGMNIVEGGVTEPFNKAMSVWQPKVQAAQQGLQSAEQDYQLGRQRTMDQSTLDDRAAQAKYREAEAARQDKLGQQLLTPQDRQTYMNNNPQMFAGMDDQDKQNFVLFGKAAKTEQERSKTKEQLYYEAGEKDAQGQLTPNAQRARQTLDSQLADEQKLARSRRDITGELTPAQRQQRQQLAESQAKKDFDVIEKMVRDGEKTGQKDARGKDIVNKYDANDPRILAMKQRVQNQLEQTYGELGVMRGQHVDYDGKPAGGAPQVKPAAPTQVPPAKSWSKAAWAKANPGKDANAAETQARQQKLNVVP